MAADRSGGRFPPSCDNSPQNDRFRQTIVQKDLFRSPGCARCEHERYCQRPEVSVLMDSSMAFIPRLRHEALIKPSRRSTTVNNRRVWTCIHCDHCRMPFTYRKLNMVCSTPLFCINDGWLNKPMQQAGNEAQTGHQNHRQLAVNEN